MDSDKQHFRHILLFYYRKSKNAVQATKKLTDVYGEVYDHLKGLGLSSKLNVWVTHVLTERNLCRRIDVCDSLFKRHENDPFLKRIITGDEKGYGEKKLDKLNDALQQKRLELINRKGVVFHQDNARPHTSLVTRQKLLSLEWDTMLHTPYSPDLAPSDYYLFRSLQNSLDGKTFISNEEVKNHLAQFFASKDQKFYERGIMLLPKSWQKRFQTVKHDSSTVNLHKRGNENSGKLLLVEGVISALGKERNLCRRIDVCDSLLKRHENDPFLKRIITGDGKGYGEKKLLPDNTTINSEVYCLQLGKLNDALQQKRLELINRKGVVFHQDNARPHTSLVTRQKLLSLE
ncbi:mariner Mos1 transposase [Trichonephila clavipes]|nr:mariner Mos1 transposase [Trichonephila clavipes]